MKIHKSDDPEYTKFKPIDKRVIKKKYKLVQCSKYQGKARVLITDLKDIKNPKCSKCKHKLPSQREIAIDLYNKDRIDKTELEVTFAEYPEK